MRFWQFGVFTSQHDEITFADLGFGRSIVVEGSTSNQDQGAADFNSATHQWNLTVSTDTSFNHGAIELKKELIKAKLGQIPILIKVNFRPWITSSRQSTIKIYRFINPPDIKDCGNRYRDLSNLITWYEDVYCPFPGQDIEDPPAYTIVGQNWTAGERAEIVITSIVERALRDNTNISFMIRISSGYDHEILTTYSNVGQWPTFEFFYFYPIEFYQADSGGDIDLLRIIDDNPGNEYYLGAVERGATGAPVKCYFRNYTDQTQQVELFDDHPEYEEPVQRAGAGTGLLDYVKLSDNAVSQLYDVIFYSSTQYEVLAVAYRDNSISLHPQIDADVSWRGSIGTDFTAPTGGLSIPSAAWQPGTLLDDDIEIGVRGNTTNTDWPADSNDQVEMTFDIAGSPDTSNWRPITGRRIRTSGAVTIDATTKLVPTRYVLPTDWPIGTPAFIHNASDYDAGVIKSIQEAEIGTPVFSGSGTDDLTVSGNYNGIITDDYVVEIDAGGTPGTYKWSSDGGSSWMATGIVPTGSAQLLNNGIYVSIPAGTAHTLGDTWTIPVASFGVELEGLTAGSTTYGSGAIVGTTLPFRDVAVAVYSQVSQDSGASESPPSRLYVESTAGFTAGDQILVTQASGANLSETVTIATGGVSTYYLDLDDALENDYTENDFVTKTSGGQIAFWKRCVAGTTTVEQLKTYRLNARIL